MLQLKHIIKDYTVGDTSIHALKGITLDFRKSEFVSILGPSGCGKTTLLNIIGGLDRYTSGDLVIDGVSTTQYQDVDWDIYRNTSIGFVFQNYNLIPHQSVLSNVELAMTLAGVSKEKRRKKAIEALNKVGLGDQLDKKPTQMSGGQMQRVAIARALVNDPKILLADEPTGALDTETSIQIMEILKEVAKDRLVIMVTHNPELAKAYSSRIIELLDGYIVKDSNPHINEKTNNKNIQKKKTSMSFKTSLLLSFNNLMTKKTRTFLTAFAGSIGIIGIALILSLSTGMNIYISDLESNTLSTYPIEIESQTTDMSSMISSMMSHNTKDGIDHSLDKVYSNNILSTMLSSMSSSTTENDLRKFKNYIESKDGDYINDITNSIQYSYGIELQIYNTDSTDDVFQVNPSEVYNMLGLSSNNDESSLNNSSNNFYGDVWEELLDNEELLESQYDVIAGQWPTSNNELVLIVDENNEVSDLVLYTLGLLNTDEIEELLDKVSNGKEIEEKDISEFSYDDILSLEYSLILNTDYYVKEQGQWVDKRDDNDYLKELIKDAKTLKIVGIIRPNEEATAVSASGSIGYKKDLTDEVIEKNNASQIAKDQNADKETNVLTGMPFESDNLTIDKINKIISSMSKDEQDKLTMITAHMNDNEIVELFSEKIKEEAESYESLSQKIGIVDVEQLSSISLYPKDFDSKEEIESMIEEYNQMQTDQGNDNYVITYTDLVGLMTSSVSSIINIITYVLIAFVAISLIVSSIMIAIITYISVLERTKEIGILRSIGASKKDISRLFNAETIIEGLVAGVIGIAIALLLNIPINKFIYSLVGISNISLLSTKSALILIAISVLLTLIAGIIPSKIAARKDPVEALRSE